MTFLADTVTARFNELLGEGIKKGRIKHISVFWLAPIPLLIHLGTLIGNKVPADFYQSHRQSQNWRWQAEDIEVGHLFAVFKPVSSNSTRDVALVLSISGKVDRAKVHAAMNNNFVTYEIFVANPGFHFLKSKERVWHFGMIHRNVLAEIRTEYGHDSTIHIFPAVPAPVAVECGRNLMRKCDSSVLVYDLLRGRAIDLLWSYRSPPVRPHNAKSAHAEPKNVHMIRRVDATGVSGPGRILDGIVFHNEQVVMLAIRHQEWKRI